MDVAAVDDVKPSGKVVSPLLGVWKALFVPEPDTTLDQSGWKDAAESDLILSWANEVPVWEPSIEFLAFRAGPGKDISRS